MMFKRYLTVLIAAGFCMGGLADENNIDTIRICDLDELIVVSQPKETFKLRHQPISSSVFSSEEFELLGCRDLKSLSSFVPSFSMPDYGSRLTSSIYIRGIGSRINNPAIGIYVDGMPLVSKNSFNFHVYEMERVDVLRGPQGTLYGQNTSGGLIKLYSKNPMTSQGTNIHLKAASHNDVDFEFGHYKKINDNTAYSVAGFYSSCDGFFNNNNLDEKADKIREMGGRARFMFNPNKRMSLDYTADFQHTNQKGFPYGKLDINSNETEDPSTTFLGNYRRNMFNTALKADYDLGFAHINSVTSYQFLNDNMLMDQDYLPQDYMHLIQKQLYNAVTEEITLKGSMGKWHHVSGIFGSYKWLRTEAPVFFGEDFTNMLENKIVSKMPAGSKMDLALDVPGWFHTPEYNIGLFHESSYKILPRLTVTAGLRYDFNNVKVAYDTYALAKMDVSVMGFNKSGSLKMLVDNNTSDKFSKFLPKLGITYEIDNKGSNIYASYSKGFRAGGFNIQMFSDILQTKVMANAKKAMAGDVEMEFNAEEYEAVNKTISYKPEESTNYEIGAHLDLAGHKLRADIALYYMTVHNMQLSVMANNYGFGRMMVNAGKSYSTGAEISLSGSMCDGNLQWMANYGLTHAVFKEYNITPSVSYKDNKVPYVPKHTVGGEISYLFKLNNNAINGIKISTDVNCAGRTWWDAANTYSQDFYALLGARAEFIMGNITAAIWGKNLTQTEYNTFAVNSSATGTNQYFAQQGRPLQIGIDLKFNL